MPDSDGRGVAIKRKVEKKERQKKHKRKRPKTYGIKAAIKLLGYAAEGRNNKLERLLQSSEDIDVNAFNAEGRTALHQAAKFGNTEAVDILLRHAADARAEDFSGNTPAHLAAASQHLSTLAELLQANDSPDLNASNANGTTIRQLMQTAMEASARACAKRPNREHSISSSEEESEDAWQQKLRENAGFDDFEGGAAEWESFEYSSLGGGRETAPCDEETYARRMWEEMNARSRKATRPSAAAADAWGRADEAQEQRRRAAEAADSSRRILEEEQAKDRAWREAVLKGDLGARRATYEAKWHVFAMSKDLITLHNVPWLVENQEEARAVILHGTSGPTEERKRIRLELMRWHPDKFYAKFGKRIASSEQQIMDRVKHMSQMLNGLAST